MEEYLKNKSSKVKEKLKKRELERVFSNLNVNPHIIDEFYDGKVNHQFYKKEEKSLKAQIKVENNHLILKIKDINNLTSFMIINKSKHILWKRDLSEEEYNLGVIKEDFSKVMNEEVLNKNGKYIIAVETKDKEPFLIEYDNMKEKISSLNKFFKPLNNIIIKICFISNWDDIIIINFKR